MLSTFWLFIDFLIPTNTLLQKYLLVFALLQSFFLCSANCGFFTIFILLLTHIEFLLAIFFACFFVNLTFSF